MNISEKVKNLCFENTRELPDCVMSYIFSKLSMKDLVKTSTLSKTWIHEWRSRKDLNFDIHNMFGGGTYQYFELEEERSPHFRVVIRPKFVERVNQFMLNYQGANIHSLKLDFPLGDDYGYVIDRLISHGISKGAQRIELLLSQMSELKPYNFFLSENDCLKYLHLQNCLLSPPMDFSRLKKLTTLVLHLVVIEKHMLLGLFSNCINLVDLTLDNCEFDSDLNITSPTLCHLNIADHSGLLRVAPKYWKIDIFALKLLCFKYNCRDGTFTFNSIKAPKLSKFYWNDLPRPDTFAIRKKKLMPPDVFCGIENLTKIVLVQVLVTKYFLPSLFSNCHQLDELTLWGCTFEFSIHIISPTLRRLNIIDFDNVSWNLDIDALNLTSLECRGRMRICSIKAPQLLNLFWNVTRTEEIPHAFDIIASLHQLQNLSINLSHSQITILPKSLGPFQYLRKLELFIGDETPNHDFFRILDIVMASPRLQELCVTIKDLHLVSDHKDIKEPERFSHNELKYVEFHGCEGKEFQNLLDKHLWGNMNSSPKKIAFKPCCKFYVGAGIWVKGNSNDHWLERGVNFMCHVRRDSLINKVYLSFCSIN